LFPRRKPVIRGPDGGIDRPIERKAGPAAHRRVAAEREVRLADAVDAPALDLGEPVTTERLVLRAFRESDLDDVHALQSDPEVVRYLYWEVRSREESRDWLRVRMAEYRLESEGDAVAYAVERRSDGRVIGSVNAWWRSAEHRQGEIGFAFARDAQGRGYASEATTALLDVVFERLDLHRVYASTDARNDASAALLRRLGLRQEAHLHEHELFKGEWGDLLVFAVLRSEWDRRRAAARTSHPS
jgi:RimJ/RimL family protein N-acetyltransferase